MWERATEVPGIASNIVWFGCRNGRVVRMNYRTGMARDVSAWPITSYGCAPEPWRESRRSYRTGNRLELPGSTSLAPTGTQRPSTRESRSHAVSCSRSADCGVVRPRRAGIRVLNCVAVCPVKMTL